MLRLIGINAGVGGVAAAFESIASATGTGSSATITFSSIPATYQHLQVRAIIRTDALSGNSAARIQFNGDTGSNYASHQLFGNGATTGAAGAASQIRIDDGTLLGTTDGTASNILGVGIFDIHDYSNTSKNTTTRVFTGRDDNSAGFVRLGSGLWMNTAAVNQITFTASTGNFTTQTVFALYGIKAA